MGILDYLQRILNQIGNLINSDFQILSTLITSGWSAVVLDAARAGLDVKSLLNDPDCGQEAQCAKLTTVIGDLASLSTALAALGAPQQAGSPVTLPTVPPTGYGGATSSANAAAVWGFISTDEGTQMGFIMSAMSVYLRILRDSLQLPLRIGDHFSLNFDCFSLVNDPTTSFNNDSANEILSTDTSVGAWLARIEPRYTWHQSANGSWWADLSGGGGEAIVNCTLTEQEFQWFRANTDHLILPSPTAPIWPGIAGVTLGAPSVLADGLIITDAMDGVLVEISSVTPRTQNIPYGTLNAYGHIGSLTFGDDNGDYEEFQYLTFANQVYCTKYLKRAASVAFRVKSGLVGTVTPWTLA